jgi:hypothetical protein
MPEARDADTGAARAGAPDADDLESALRPHAEALAAAVDRYLPGWVERCVERVHRERVGPPPASVLAAAVTAGREAQADIGVRVRALLAVPSDEQRTTPLAVLREGAAYPTKVLLEVGVPVRERDAMDTAMFPNDVYALGPATFADLDPALAEPGLAWGAAKAWVHRRRHG